MKGLFMKDLLWLKQQKRMLMIVLLLVLLYLFGDMYGFMLAFLPCWMVLLCTRIILNDLDGSSSRFLFTLPFSRNQYVTEKFLLCMGAGGLSLVLVGLLAWVLGGAATVEFLPSALATLPPVLIIMCAVIIPLSIRFKNNYTLIMMLSGVFILLVVFAFQDSMPSLEIPAFLQSSWMIPVLWTISLLLLAISWKLSTVFLNKEQL